AGDGDAVPLVAGNLVVVGDRRAADGGAAGVLDQDAGPAVAHRGEAVGGQADQVTHHQRVGGAAARRRDADGDAGVLVLLVGVVAGDDVAADGRAAGATVNGNAGLLVAVGDLSAGTHADVVAEDWVALDREAEGAEDLHAVAGVAGDDVAGPRVGAADDVAAAHDQDALAVGHGAVAQLLGADQVVDEGVAVALEEHAL